MRIVLRCLVLVAAVCTLCTAAVPPLAHAAPPVAGSYSLSLNTSSVDFGTIDPEVTAVESNAVRVVVDGSETGTSILEVSYEATDFVAAVGGVPDIPIGCMTYVLRGAGGTERPFTSGEVIATESPAKRNWKYVYAYDYALTVPYDYEAGSYTASVVYTAVLW